MLLVDTNPPWVHGSMARYAALVAKTSRETSSGPNRFAVTPINVALPLELPAWFSRSLATWLNHAWIWLTAAWRIRRRRPDLVHLLDGSHAYLLAGLNACRRTATVHDLIPLVATANAAARQNRNWFAGRLLARSLRGLRRCERLAAVSQHTANDLARQTGIDPERVDLAPLACDPALVKAAGDVSARAACDLPHQPPYLLHVGHNGWYKNRAGVVRIFAAVAAAVDCHLILAGPPPDDALRRLARDLGIGDRLRFAAIADDEQLAALYRGAAVCLFPSLYEGFGWPPLEAMACSCPVVCSAEASLPEVVGAAALTAPARDENTLAALCISVLTDARLAGRLRELGRARSGQFAPERMMAALYSCWERAVRTDVAETGAVKAVP